MADPTITPMRIGDRLVGADDGDEARSIIEVRSPYDGHPVGAVPAATEGDIDDAVAVALARHRAGPPPAHVRAEVLDTAARLLEADQERFARSIAEEAAKPITTARVEAARAVDTFRFSAAAARTSTGRMIPLDASAAGAGKLGFTLRVPIGVVAAVSPFNFPLNLVAHKLAPAIAAGCPVVLKPASSTPLTALALAELVSEAGLEPGWCNVVTCPGRVADHLVTHDDVAMVTFTGSAEVGWSIRARAARKEVALELGNNAPVIVEPDADLALAAQKVAAGGFGYAGQTCISVQRVYVHRRVHDAFLDELVPRVESLVVGDPLDDATVVSALITPGDTERVGEVIAAAAGAGARIVCGGTVGDDGVLAPTVVDAMTPTMSLCRDEVFGPVVGVAAYDDWDEALRLAGDTRYGLQASVFTADVSKALTAARRLDFGGVLVNEMPTWRADQMPYGGVRDSGNTREGPAFAVEHMTVERLVVLPAPD